MHHELQEARTLPAALAAYGMFGMRLSPCAVWDLQVLPGATPCTPRGRASGLYQICRVLFREVGFPAASRARLYWSSSRVSRRMACISSWIISRRAISSRLAFSIAARFARRASPDAIPALRLISRSASGVYSRKFTAVSPFLSKNEPAAVPFPRLAPVRLLLPELSAVQRCPNCPDVRRARSPQKGPPPFANKRPEGRPHTQARPDLASAALLPPKRTGSFQYP